MFLILFIIALASLVFYHFYTHYSRCGRILNKLPGPPIIPIIGNVNRFLGSPVDVWNSMRNMNKKYNRLSRYWLMHYPLVNMCHPNDAEVLLSNMKEIEKGIDYNFLHPWAKSGLLTSTGKKWQQRRKLLTPAFHFNVLHQFLDIFNEQAQILVQNLKSGGTENIQDLVSLFKSHLLNTICETAMGTSLHETDKKNTYRKAAMNLLDILHYRGFRPWLTWDWVFNLFSKGKLLNEYLSTLNTFSSKIIAERKEFHEKTGDHHLKSILSSNTPLVSSEGEIEGRKKRMAMLDHLIAAQKFHEKIDDEGMAEEVDTFIFAGHDTTATAMCFTVLMLAENKEIQDKAREEADKVLGEKNRKIGSAEVLRLNYLEQCIKETLRLYSIAPLISRKIKSDLQLENNLIPAGSSIVVHIFDIHRDPNFWPNPEKYDPDRFSTDKLQKRHPFSYIPFGAGSRNCIGQKFAMLELKTFIAHLLHNFVFEPIDKSQDLILSSNVVLDVTTPVRVKFITRVK